MKTGETTGRQKEGGKEKENLFYLSVKKRRKKKEASDKPVEMKLFQTFVHMQLKCKKKKKKKVYPRGVRQTNHADADSGKEVVFVTMIMVTIMTVRVKRKICIAIADTFSSCLFFIFCKFWIKRSKLYMLVRKK